MTGCGRDALMCFRDAFPDVREWLRCVPDDRKWLGGPPGCSRVVGKPSRVVGRPSQTSGSGQEALPMSRSGREALLVVR